ncbi:hypothetical protein APHCRT_0993 [Anaplasma phagocytophilum str. CRT53-1]|uniref:Uncharacterized protein n=1 Tax=Anaplasma phagocytophilum str. CRT53-1 TaxID=1359157 RepID=A0A0F3Q0L8_ANAPH|nr:hypothetical protein APHCRT_0993 [Anaplasma phagocytophilum str. CRT53-1]
MFAIVAGTALSVLPPECTAGVMPSLFWVCSVVSDAKSLQERCRPVKDYTHRSFKLSIILTIPQIRLRI